MCDDLDFINRLTQGISGPATRLPTMYVWTKFPPPEMEEWNRRERRLAEQEMKIMERSYEGIVQVVNRVEEFIKAHEYGAVFFATLSNIDARLGNAEIILRDKHGGGDATLRSRISELRRRAKHIRTTNDLPPSEMKKPPYPDVCSPSPSSSTGLCPPSTRSYNDATDDCPICMSVLGSREIARLRCGHSFHKGCVDEWLAEHRTCPMCRANV